MRTCATRVWFTEYYFFFFSFLIIDTPLHGLVHVRPLLTSRVASLLCTVIIPVNLPCHVY
ncbi:hypothetical protein BO85DRAFT_271606 [Aspergillus piperis CBS 112811]|uniref:Uncharacterized protein n=1 Tax=Aspergillus piperis CBS 112811 TaxID=1448313 RepID=A0A8G1R439_9EURO|nr:hypothetical protein BO85DRAFT_271606 [Aspergillus piperis CBS 112811]RAH58306.1 hypothetical protein BO85DRAFT_271606 [Aspergillus piperis CBS 112811]